MITVTGVKALDGLILSDKTVTVAASALNQGTVTISDGYTLALGSDVAAPSTTLGYKLEDNQIKYGVGIDFMITGVKSFKGISLSGKTVTISKSALKKETVTISNGYKLALADNVPGSETYPVNEYNPDTMTYITKGTTSGYTLADNEITYSKGTATKLKFTGVAEGAKATNFSLKNKTITIGKAAVKTDGTPLELMTDGYTLKLGKKMAAPKTTTTTTSTGGRSVTKGYLLSGNTLEYVNENVKIKNTDGKFSMDGTISDGRTFTGTSNADKVTVTGAFNLKIKTGAGNDAVTLNGKN